MSNSIEFESLGTFMTGEVPLPLSVRYDDATGTQIDISTGYTGIAFWKPRGDDEEVPGTLGVAIDNSVNVLGLAVVTFTATPFAVPGSFFLEVWVGTAAGIKLDSVTYSYYVQQSVVLTAPTFPVP